MLRYLKCKINPQHISEFILFNRSCLINCGFHSKSEKWHIPWPSHLYTTKPSHFSFISHFLLCVFSLIWADCNADEQNKGLHIHSFNSDCLFFFFFGWCNCKRAPHIRFKRSNSYQGKGASWCNVMPKANSSPLTQPAPLLRQHNRSTSLSALIYCGLRYLTSAWVKLHILSGA